MPGVGADGLVHVHLDLGLGQLAVEEAHLVHAAGVEVGGVGRLAEEERHAVGGDGADLGADQLAVHVEQQGGAVVAGGYVVPVVGALGREGVGDLGFLAAALADAEADALAGGGRQGVQPPVFGDGAAQVEDGGAVVAAAELDPCREGELVAGEDGAVVGEGHVVAGEAHGGAEGGREGHGGLRHGVAAEGLYLAGHDPVGVEEAQGGIAAALPEGVDARHLISVELAGDDVEVNEGEGLAVHGSQEEAVAVDLIAGGRRAERVGCPRNLDAVFEVALTGKYDGWGRG